MNRDDFPILETGITYFDNGATTFKPKVVVDSIVDYYTKYTANAHRGDYANSLKVDTLYEETREIVRDFINAKSTNEIIFTSGTTDSLNRIIFGYFGNLTSEDEVILTKSEHASNILPWFELGVKIKYIELTKDYEVTLENVIKAITPKTKVISLAHITNVIGDVRPIEEIIKYAHEHDIKVVIDGAQSIPHIKIDVQALDIDFLAFSGHKMCGPTGIGVLYGKEELLANMRPLLFGGGMNASFMSDGTRIYHELPTLHEAGTQNIAGVIGLGRAIKYLNSIGMDKIHEYELELKDYAISKLEQNPNIILYNKHSRGGIITFNYKDVFSQDLAIYLDKRNIAVRSGNHCAKVLIDEIGIKNTCRVSLYFYNTKEEIDKLISALNNPKLKEELI